MKIILFDILLICAIAEIFAKWSPSDTTETDIYTTTSTPIRAGLSYEQQPKNDILDIQQNKDELELNFNGFHDLPLEEILTALLPGGKNKPKKKSKNTKSKAKNNIDQTGVMAVTINENYDDKSLPDQIVLTPELTTGNMYQMFSNIPDQQEVNNEFAVDPKQPYTAYQGNLLDKLKRSLPTLDKTDSLPQKRSKHLVTEHNDKTRRKNSDLDLLSNELLENLLNQLKGNLSKRKPNKNKNSKIALTNQINSLISKLRSQLDETISKNFTGSGADSRDLKEFQKFSRTLFNKYNGDEDTEVKYIPIDKNIKNKTKNYLEKFKKLLKDVVSKYLNKAVKQSKDDVKAKQGFSRHRSKRQTQAGYTQDPETCKKYNDNLTKMWSTLSKYINYTDSVNEIALHNIAVMVEAYLDHKTKKAQEHPIDVSRDERKRDKISEYLRKIKKILGTEDAPDKVKDIILENFKPEYDEDPDCKQTNEDNLISSIALSYQNYLENAKCHGDYDTGLLRGKALLRGGAPIKKEMKLTNNINDLSDHISKSILNENESSEEFQRNKLPVSKRSRSRSISLRRVARRSTNRNYDSKKDYRSGKLRSGSSKSKSVGRKKSRGRKRTHVRTDESCVKYANRKFLITLRTSIERFMSLRDCQQDDTLRTSNRQTEPEDESVDEEPETNVTKPETKKITTKIHILRTNERTFNDRNIYADAELGQREQDQITNYLSRVKEFDGQNPTLMNKPIFVVHSTTYKDTKPLLLKIKNNQDGSDQNSASAPYPVHIASSQGGYGNNFNSHNQNIDKIYKAFLESSNLTPKNIFLSTKNSGQSSFGNQQLRENSQSNLYEVLKKKVEEQNFTTTTATPTKIPIETVARQNDDMTNVTFVDIDIDNSSNSGILLAHAANYNRNTSDGMSVNFDAMDDILKDVRNTSLQTPQVDTLSFTSGNEKGYVELSYLVKYPKSIIYRPQYLVKNILQYEDFVKIANQLYITDDDKQLLKIVRYLPNNTSQTLFETEDFTAPIEIRDVNIKVNESVKLSPLLKENISTSSEVPQPLEKVTIEPDNVHNDDTNQTETYDEKPGAREGPLKEDANMDLNVSASENIQIYQKENDYISYEDSNTADGLSRNNSNVEPKELGRSSNDTTFNLHSVVNMTVYNFNENKDIDDRIFEILNASLNSGEFINSKEELDAIAHNITAYNIDDESIADYLRFRLDNAEANLSEASHAYLKELESQGVSSSTLTKSMLRTWWQSWKNKLNTKFQTIRGTVASMLKKFDRNSTTTEESDVVPTNKADSPSGDA